MCVHPNVTQLLFSRHIAAFGSTRFSPTYLSSTEWSTTILLKPPTCKSLCKAEPQHPCNAIAISQPELPAPFKGSSQDAHLMQGEGRLKPQPGTLL